LACGYPDTREEILVGKFGEFESTNQNSYSLSENTVSTTSVV